MSRRLDRLLRSQHIQRRITVVHLAISTGGASGALVVLLFERRVCRLLKAETGISYDAEAVKVR